MLGETMNMLKKITFTITLMVLSGNLLAANSEKQQMNSDKAQITQVFENYMSKYNHFINKQELKLSPALYSEHVMLISGNGKATSLTSEKMNQGVTGFLTQLKAKGVSKVAWETVEVKLLANNIALASNVAVRYLANGEVYDRAGATYFLNKAATGWEISAFALHAPEQVLSLSTQG